MRVEGQRSLPLEMVFFLPRPADHHKPSDPDGSCSGSLDTESPCDVWSPNSRYGHQAWLMQADPSLLGCDGLLCGSRLSVADVMALTPQSNGRFLSAFRSCTGESQGNVYLKGLLGRCSGPGKAAWAQWTGRWYTSSHPQ